MRDIFIRVLNSAKENSPALLTGVAVAGVIGTFLLTDHAAVRANHILADAYERTDRLEEAAAVQAKLAKLMPKENVARRVTQQRRVYM